MMVIPSNSVFQLDLLFFGYVRVQHQVSVLNILFQTLNAIFSNWCFSLWRG